MTSQDGIYVALDWARGQRDRFNEGIRMIENGLAMLDMPLESPDASLRRASVRKTAEQHLVEILRDLNNKPTNYHDLAKLLIDRGHRGNLREGDVVGSREHRERIAKSITGTLSHNKEVFEALGRGDYRLRSFTS